jgi:hypothetical protein
MSEVKPGELKLMEVVRIFCVTCGRCRSVADVLETTHGGKPSVERILRARGWSLTGSYGWICPACASKRRKRKDGTVEEGD